MVEIPDLPGTSLLSFNPAAARLLPETKGGSLEELEGVFSAEL